jgi:hypothetical protein
MFSKTEVLRVVLPIALAASVLTTGIAPASAVPPSDGYYGCNSGTYESSSSGTGRYRILSGIVSSGSSCTGYVRIPSGITVIAGSAFLGSEIIGITIPSSVTSINTSAFESTNSISLVIFENQSELVFIGKWAFYRSSLTSITIPSSVETIDSWAFEASNLTTLNFASGSNLSTIQPFAFYGTSLKSLSIPSSVTSIGESAFYGSHTFTEYSNCDSTLTQTQLNTAGLNGKTRISDCSSTHSPLFSSVSSYDGRVTVQIANYDSAFTYSATSSAGQASVNSSGLVTVTGLRPDQSVTVTVTVTRSGYASLTGSITGSSQVAPMLPGTKPTVTINDTLITCTIGSYSAAPTSAAFSLFVDGKHISTNFSALGDYLPDWIIPWATSSTITRTATSTSATWATSDAYRGKEITCATLAYSKNAIGFTATQALIAR